MDLKLDGDSHDLLFVNGECPVTTESREVVAQRLKIRLLTFRNEWFLSLSYGVPYWQRILGKKVTKAGVDRIFQEDILKERGVLEISSFNSTFKNREYSMSFRVRTNGNQVTEEITINEVI
ncbi:hypothetical protein D3C85_969970 [compost metagenome]